MRGYFFNHRHTGNIERFMSLCIWYHITALELVGGIASPWLAKTPGLGCSVLAGGFPFYVCLGLVPEAIERPHKRVHC